MEPEIVERTKLLLAGVINTGKDVGNIDIQNLWNVFEKSESSIPNHIKGKWYELHVGNELGNGIYSVIAEAEIREIGELPVEVSLKIIPAGKYIHFTHPMKDGGFSEAFAQVGDWINRSNTKVKDFGLQFYDSDFNPEENENSILHIYIPLD